MGSRGDGGDTHPGAGRGDTAGSGKGSIGRWLEALLGGQGEGGGTVVSGGEGSVGAHWCHLGRVRGVSPGASGTFALPDPRQNPDPMLWDGDSGGGGRHSASPERALPCRWVPKPGQLPGRCQDPADGNAGEQPAMTEPLSRFSESAWGADVVSAAL